MADSTEERQHTFVELLAADSAEQRIPAFDEHLGLLAIMEAEEEIETEAGEEDSEEHDQQQRVEELVPEAEREEALELSKGVESDFLDVALEEQRQQHTTESEDT